MSEFSNVPMAAGPEPFYQTWLKALTRPNEQNFAEMALSAGASPNKAFVDLPDQSGQYAGHLCFARREHAPDARSLAARSRAIFLSPAQQRGFGRRLVRRAAFGGPKRAILCPGRSHH